MRYYTRCQTEIQKDARKILRAAVRGLRHVQLINPSELTTDGCRYMLVSQIRTFKRIIAAYHDTKTDNELIAAMELSVMLSESMVEMEEMRERMDGEPWRQ